MTPDQKAALTKIATAAVDNELMTGVPAELTACQAILETGWLKHAPGNNCFGIKASARHTFTQQLMTTEHIDGQDVTEPQTFAAYDSLQDCFRDHDWTIKTVPAYRKAWTAYQTDRDLNAFILGVAKVWATDPQYGAKLMALAGSENVKSAIAVARSVPNS